MKTHFFLFSTPFPHKKQGLECWE